MSAQLEVGVPGLLADCTGGKKYFSIEAQTLESALDSVFSTYPLLRLHVYDETGTRRPHVLIYYNGESIDWIDRLDVPLGSGDRIDILQAVSGG